MLYRFVKISNENYIPVWVTESENVSCFKNGNEWSQIEVLDTQTPQELPASHTTGYQLQNFEAMNQPSGTLEKGNKDVVYQLEPRIKQNLNSNLNFVCQAGISPINNLHTAMASGTFSVENRKNPQMVNRQSNFYIDVYQRVKEALFHEGQGPTCSPIKNNNENVSKETGSRGTTHFPQEIVKIHDTLVEAPNQDVSVVNSSDADQV
ncbi:hypothetical protein Tco_0526883 [Tanacetum coccineum]